MTWSWPLWSWDNFSILPTSGEKRFWKHFTKEAQIIKADNFVLNSSGGDRVMTALGFIHVDPNVGFHSRGGFVCSNGQSLIADLCVSSPRSICEYSRHAQLGLGSVEVSLSVSSTESSLSGFKQTGPPNGTSSVNSSVVAEPELVLVESRMSEMNILRWNQGIRG